MTDLITSLTLIALFFTVRAEAAYEHRPVPAPTVAQIAFSHTYNHITRTP